MPLFRAPDGSTVEIDDAAYAATLGYSPVSSEERYEQIRADAAAPKDRGFIGGVNAALTGAASGLTLGASDVVLGALLTDAQREQMRDDIATHKLARGGGEIAGTLAASFAAPGSALARTPAGFLAQTTARGIEQSAAKGGLRALAGTAAWSGVEAAVQSGGMYLADTAIQDRDATAEGMAGALGRGFAFGSIAGGTVFGIERGTMAARRMFAKTADAKAAEMAESVWRTKSDEILTAHEDVARIAQMRLDEIASMKIEAQTMKARANEEIAAARLELQMASKPGVPREAPDALTARPGELPSDWMQRMLPRPAPVEALPQRELMRQEIEAGRVVGETGPFTPKGVDLAAEREIARRAELASTDLGQDLLAMQTRLAAGESLKSMRAPLGNEIANEEAKLANMLGEFDAAKADLDMWTALYGAGHIDQARAAMRQGGELADVEDAALILTRYEKAAADLTEAVGDAAPRQAQEVTKALRDAETDNLRRESDRVVRALDDEAEIYGPARGTPKERIADARASKLEADAQLAKLKTQEIETRQQMKAAKSAASDTKRAVDTISLGKPGPGRAVAAPSRAGQAADFSSALEIIGGIPGLPKPSDLPLVGPLLGAYLKLRAYKTMAGKLFGRVGASGEAKAAALASSTRDKIAAGVDRALGLVERNAMKARPVAIQLQKVLSDRVFDDGEPSPRDGSVRELAAARSREVAAAVANPRAYIANVRKQAQEIADPDLLAALEKHHLRLLEYLDKHAPKAPAPTPLAPKRTWSPSEIEARRFARRLQVVDDPGIVFDLLEDRSLTNEAIETLRTVYPTLYSEAQRRLVERAAEIRTDIPYDERLRMSLLFDVDLDPSMEPATIALYQTAYQQSPANATTSGAAPTQNQPPMPSIAGSVDLMALYQTPADRRDARR
jgi:hypothetical protein